MRKLLFPLLALILLSSCVNEERFLTDSSAKLVFSDDTVKFDTVFTTMATITRQVKIYNRYDEALLLDAVTLLGGHASRFRINVDGDTSFVARDVEIAAHDSIFIFIQANIDPNNSLEPFLRTDSIVFHFNNRDQYLPVMAYGRNAVYHHPTHPRSVYQLYINDHGEQDTLWMPFSVIDCKNWDHTRPHVIFGYAVVDSRETLSLYAGDELYFGNNSYLWVYDSATLDVHGTQGNPVRFSSIRHDFHYDSLPGQWGYIWLSTGSKDNRIEWARIENSTYGIVVDTNVNSNPTLTIYNSVIQDISSSGIVGQGAWIVGDNLLVANCGESLLQLQYGGRYCFSNSTFANYWRYKNRKTPSVVLNNYYAYNRETIFPRSIEQAEFRNCIIYGTFGGNDNSGEIKFDYLEGVPMNATFLNCLLRTTLIDSNGHATFTPAPNLRCSNLLIDKDPDFNDPFNHDYTPSEESPAAGAGNYEYLHFPYDLRGVPRPSSPTLGALEPTPATTEKTRTTARKR